MTTEEIIARIENEVREANKFLAENGGIDARIYALEHMYSITLGALLEHLRSQPKPEVPR